MSAVLARNSDCIVCITDILEKGSTSFICICNVIKLLFTWNKLYTKRSWNANYFKMFNFMKDNEFVAFPLFWKAKKCNFLFLVIYTFFCYFHSKLNRYHTTMECNAAYVQMHVLINLTAIKRVKLIFRHTKIIKEKQCYSPIKMNLVTFCLFC